MQDIISHKLSENVSSINQNCSKTKSKVEQNTNNNEVQQLIDKTIINKLLDFNNSNEN